MSSSLSLLGEAFHVHPPGGDGFNQDGDIIFESSASFCPFYPMFPIRCAFVATPLTCIGSCFRRTFIIGPYQGEDSLDSYHPLHLLGVLPDPALWHLELQILGPSVLDACYSRLK